MQDLRTKFKGWTIAGRTLYMYVTEGPNEYKEQESGQPGSYPPSGCVPSNSIGVPSNAESRPLATESDDT